MRVLTATLVAATLALSACTLLTGPVTPVPAMTSTPTAEDVPVELAPYYRQQLIWESCETGLHCATAIAPLDWTDPAGERIELALVRRPASGPRVGSLLLNPGGPGGSAYDWVVESGEFAATPDVLEAYDLIGLDPRGVGHSTPVTCADDDAARDAYFFGIVPGEPGTPQWLTEVRAETAAWTAGCVEHSGDLLEHVDTGSAARDLDMIRAALGETKLDYLGYSYGTYLGARYAELFPDHVGRFVLDGALDPSLTGTELVLGQAVGFERAFRTWLASCLTQQDCPFRGSVDDAMARVARLFDSVSVSPLRGVDGRELGAQALFSAVIVPLYDPATWGYLGSLFTELELGQTDTAFALIDALYGRDANGVYSSNQSEGQLAVNCLDIPFDATEAGMAAEAELLAAAAPLFGPLMSWGGISCEFWPVAAPVAPREPIVAPGAGDILVIGTTGDPATPYEWSVTLAGDLEGGHLLSYDGEGHTAYNRGESCVDDAVDGWLLDGILPKDGLAC